MANANLLATDSFGSGSIGVNWTAIATQVKSQVVTSLAEAPGVGTAGRQYYSGISWPNDQCSELIAKTLNTSGSTVDLWVRVQTGAYSGYAASVSAGGNAVSLYKCVAGVFTQLGISASVTIAANDVWALQVVGAILTVTQNNKPLIHYMDTTFTSGSPGFSQGAGGNVANSQISTWKGYNAVQQDGVWQKQGVLTGLVPLSGDIGSGAGGIANASMLYEGNAQLLSGTVYKMWFGAGAANAESNTYYAESTDGLNWTRKGTVILTSQGSPFIFKNGATYYLYTQPSGSIGAGGFNVYTSSDGVTFTIAATNFLTLGGVGTWDHTIMWYFQPVAIINGTWYAVYSGGNNTSVYQLSLGLATSSDGITWTKYVSNPVLSLASGGSVVNSCAVAKVGSTYYMWVFASQPGQGAASPNLNPGEGVRYKTTDFINWTLDSHSVHTTGMFEGCNSPQGQSYPNGIFTVGNQTYMYIQSGFDASSPSVYELTLAIAPTTITSLVTQPEDAMPQVATDGFTSGIGDLSANWTTPTGLNKLQIISGNLTEATATSTLCGMRYTGSSFGDSQYSEFTLQTLAASQIVYSAVRMQAGGDCYLVNIQGVTGASNANFAVFKRVSGVLTQIGPVHTATPNAGDKFRLSVVNVNSIPTLTFYQNQFQVLQVEDFTNAVPSGGNPGLLINTSTLVQAQVSGWSGGNANVIPAYMGAAGGLVHLGNFPTFNFTGSVQVGNFPVNQ